MKYPVYINSTVPVNNLKLLQGHALTIIIAYLVSIYFFTPVIGASGKDIGDFNYRYKLWTVRDGLPDNNAQAILQSRDGFLWIGTGEGLAKFDGSNFQIIGEGEYKYLQTDEILALAEGQDESIWIGTVNKGLIRIKDGKISLYGEKYHLPNDLIISLCITTDGSLWIGFRRSGLYRLNNDKLKKYSEEDGFFGNSISSIVQDEEGKIWIGTSNGLSCYFKSGFSRFDINDGLPGNHILSLLVGKDNTLYIGTDKGLSIYKDQKYVNYSEKDGIKGNSVRHIMEDDKGRIWIGSVNGILIFDHNQFTSLDLLRNFKSKITRVLYKDRSGNIWFSLGGIGLIKISDGFFSSYTTDDGLSSNSITSIIEDHEGNIWFGSLNDGINCLKQGKFIHYSTANGLASNIIYCLYEDPFNNIWIGSWRNLTKYSDDRFISYPVGDMYIYSMYMDDSSNLWIGTSRGLYRFDNGKLIKINQQNKTADIILSLQQDKNNKLICGSYCGGLYQIDRSTRVFKPISKTLIDTCVLTAYIDKENVYWIGTKRGLVRYDNGKITNYTTGDGLYSNSIYQILEDDYRRLWFSCNKGIFHVNKNELNEFAEGKTNSVISISYNDSDGLVSYDFVGGLQNAGIKSRSGLLYFPTSSGVVIIDPNRLKQQWRSLPVIIDKMTVDKKRIFPGENIVLEPDSMNIEFHYTAISFVSPEGIRFQYKLEGFDGDWIVAGTRKTAYYTNLPPGDYIFSVRAKTLNNKWYSAKEEVIFTLKPYFYETLWFYILTIISFIFIVFIIAYLRMRHMKLRQQELERTVEERTKQLLKAQKVLQKLTNRDGLTDLYNRQYFMQALKSEWKISLKKPSILSMMIIDIDLFRDYNKNYGDDAGDSCLKKVANVIKKQISSTSFIASRYGGEEFAVLLPATELTPAIMLANEIRRSVENFKIKNEFSRVSEYLTVSIGVGSILPDSTTAYKSLVSITDIALYEAKRKGRNRTETSHSIYSAD